MHDAARAVDYETIVLLFGMMVVVSYLRLAGFFALATERIAAPVLGTFTLLAVTIALSGVLSAFLVNDVVCVALTPLVLHLCQRLRRPPIPYLVGLATASNIGSVATITGNPQNIIIGSLSHISYLRFAARLAPVALIGLVINFAVVALVYRKALSDAVRGPAESTDESTAAPSPSRPAVQERRGDLDHGRPVLRRPADRARGPRRGRRADARSRPPREGLPVDRLAAAGHVRRAVRGRPRLRGQCRSHLGPRALARPARVAGRAGQRAVGACCRTWCRTSRRCCCSSRSWT